MLKLLGKTSHEQQSQIYFGPWPDFVASILLIAFLINSFRPTCRAIQQIVCLDMEVCRLPWQNAYFFHYDINDRHTKTFESSILSNVPPISCHPNFLLFLFLRSVAFWDIRNVKGAKSKLSSLHRTRVVTSAYFSPLTGSQVLVTSSDDYVT